MLLGIQRCRASSAARPCADASIASASPAAITPRDSSVVAHFSRTVGCACHFLVHHRLRERRLVAFVVSVAPVADEIDQEVALELRAIGERQPRRRDARFGIVGVHVDDRNLEPARQAAGVQRAVRVVRVRREPDLVVRDDVNRAAGRIARQPVQVQRLGDDALARETPRRRESGSAAPRRD